MKRIATCVLASFVLWTGAAHGEDTAEQLIRAGSEHAQQQAEPGKSPEQRWQEYVKAEGWDTGETAGGVMIIPDRQIIISSASAYTGVRLGQPGWVESRVAAFEQAEMEAKAKIIRYLTETAESKRSLSMLENAVWHDGEVNKVKELDEVAEILDRIGMKTLDLTESNLDNALRKLDPEYDPEKYATKSAKDLQVIAEAQFKRQVQAVAMKTLIGVAPVYSAEGKAGNNEYQVLVGVIWSPKLNRLALSLFNDEYNIPAVAPNKPLTEQIPEEEALLIGTVGARIVIDENGQYAVLAYGQAQPRRASLSREQAALHDAKQIAANRARGYLVNFIQEGLTLRESELSEELSREFSDMTLGTEVVREYQRRITGKNVKVQLRGLRVLKEWTAQHPETGQPVAGAIVSWNPASAELGKQAAEMMEKTTPAEAAATTDKGAASPLESLKVNTTPY